MNAADAGLAIWVLRVPLRISSIHSPDPMGMARTTICLPVLVFTPCRLKAAVTSVIHFSFSEPYVKTSSRELDGSAASPSLDCCCFLHATRGRSGSSSRIQSFLLKLFMRVFTKNYRSEILKQC